MSDVQLFLGDNLDVLATMPDNSVDSIVTDPPYGLSDHGTVDVVECLAAWMVGQPYVTKKAGGFMGRSWDAWVPGPEVWRECYRVLKPGGYLLCFASTRTDDLMSIAIRLAGFRKHPFLAWIFGQGWAKATNLGKMIDKQAGAEREVVGVAKGTGVQNPEWNGTAAGRKENSLKPEYDVTAPATPEAEQWDGWYYGLQSMKPAVEPILMFQKPPDRSMVDNVLHWGTGAVNIDACRVGSEGGTTRINGSNAGRPRNTLHGGNFGVQSIDAGRWPANVVTDGSDEVVAEFPAAGAHGGQGGAGGFWGATQYGGFDHNDGSTGSAARFFFQAKDDAPAGRWPPNVVIDGSDEVVAEFPESSTTGRRSKRSQNATVDGTNFGTDNHQSKEYPNEIGSAARFMYQAKAGRRERWFLCRECGASFPGDQRDEHGHGHVDANGRQTWQHIRQHETQKPVALMRWLVKLCTPPGGTVLDPFVGSGSTLEAAELEGFDGIGIDREADFIEIARARIGAARLPLLSETQPAASPVPPAGPAPEQLRIDL